ncbi:MULTISPECIES: sulfurtransferase complex subunit TusB [unclassified Lonepinella]|uniref:sulfurtransferase complex subunit TusB n=1 Tax=unclassified Lonepinella TaxID=2642006 RepID=UPI003F6DA821
MLYTISNAQYSTTELQRYVAQLTEQDAVVLWGNGVLLMVKQAEVLQQIQNGYIMQDDLTARHLQQHPNLALLKNNLQPIDMAQFVSLTEQYSPQLAL